MKADVYIVDAYSNSLNGYNTFREELISILRGIDDIKLHLLTEEYPVRTISTYHRDGIEYMYLPPIVENKFAKLEDYLRQVITPSQHMIFITNFFPAIFNLLAIKKLFPVAKIIHIIHDLPWLTLFQGNQSEYRHTLLENHTKKDFISYVTYDIVRSLTIVDKVISLCQSTSDFISDAYGIPAEKQELISNGLPDIQEYISNTDIGAICDKYNVPRDKKIVIYAGRLTKSKGADRIQPTITTLTQEFPCHFIYAGADSIAEWIDDTAPFSLSSVGFLSRTELFKLYALADIGLLTSRHEQCSFSGIELLMHGLPVISWPEFGVKDMFTPENSILMPEGIKKLTKTHLSIIGRNARKTFLQKYNGTTMRQRYSQLIYSLLQ
ncbi:MAG: glycosyltransferase [Paramuribaculum sp.]|nr:glycosyltransferase [Paramuribaculum sp.]MDE6304716.1 glycosyltransferase [Paramuribaculum sp.]